MNVTHMIRYCKSSSYQLVPFTNDGRLLAENVSDKEAVNQMQMAICRDRLLSQRRDIVEQIVRKNRMTLEKIVLKGIHTKSSTYISKMAILPVEFLMEVTRPFSSAANNLVLPFELLSFEKNSSSEPITLDTWALWLHADNSGHISGYPETLKLSTFTF